jgi:hypothetical protein
MDGIVMLLVAWAGLTCIWLGYKLFCGLPAISVDGPQASRSSVFLMNVVPGALLALVGSGLLTADARVLTHHSNRSHTPAGQGASWHHTRSEFRTHAA